MPLEKEKPGDDSVGVKQYIDKQFEWQKRVDKLNAYLSGTEAKLRELSISAEAKLSQAIIEGERKLVQSQIEMIRENAKLFKDNLEAWKAVNNEWKDQSKEKEKVFATKTETEKDILRLEAMIKPVTEFVQTSQGGSKVWYIVIGVIAAIVGYFIKSALKI